MYLTSALVRLGKRQSPEAPASGWPHRGRGGSLCAAGDTGSRARAGIPAGACSAPSSRGLGRRPLKAVTPVRIRSGLHRRTSPPPGTPAPSASLAPPDPLPATQPTTSLSRRRAPKAASEINTRLWVVPVVMCCRLEPQALPAVRNLAVSHDHEGFTTLRSSESFAIMKVSFWCAYCCR